MNWQTYSCSLILMVALSFTQVLAQSTTQITALSHQVHMDAVTAMYSSEAASLEDELQEAGVEIEWQTVPWPDMQERVFREVSLSSSSISLVFVLDQWLSPRLVSQLMPLDDFLADAPIQNFEGIPQGMLEFTTVDGSIYGIPMRAYGPVLFYNTELLAAAGYASPPETFEEFLEMAEEASGRRADGARVYGLRFDPQVLIDFPRAFGGGTVSNDYEIQFTDEPMLKALRAANRLYEAGAIPENFMNMSADDYLTLEQNGQIAMSIRGPTYYNNLNDPEASNVAGKIGVANVPLAEDQGPGVSPGNLSFWMMTIPSNAADPEAAWTAIRTLSSDQAATTMALNGNAPTKLAVYDDPQFQRIAGAYVEPARKSLEVARPGWPPFDEQARAVAIFDEQAAMAVVGLKTPEDAMEEAASRIAPLLPQGE